MLSGQSCLADRASAFSALPEKRATPAWGTFPVVGRACPRCASGPRSGPRPITFPSPQSPAEMTASPRSARTD